MPLQCALGHSNGGHFVQKYSIVVLPPRLGYTLFYSCSWCIHTTLLSARNKNILLINMNIADRTFLLLHMYVHDRISIMSRLTKKFMQSIAKIREREKLMQLIVIN